MELCKSKYIIFDFDGVIVDSEREYYKAWKDASIYYGYELSNEELLSLRSCDKSIASSLFNGIDNYNTVREKRRVIMNNYLKINKFPLKKGIYELFEYLRNKGYTIIIATSSSLDMVNIHLEYYGLNKYISEVLSVKGLKRGKPYPDIYEYICSHYGLIPNEVLAIEDSPNGIKSAYGASCKVVMIPDLTDVTDDIKGMVALVCKNAIDLINYL